ncbi:15138_t:CDS:2 [Gigaspora rosea]|nr:15138_t:CDS:2 [Gigaspora rosea]
MPISKIKKKPIAHSGKTAQEIFDEIKNANGEVTYNEILNYMKKNGSSLRFNVDGVKDKIYQTFQSASLFLLPSHKTLLNGKHTT